MFGFCVLRVETIEARCVPEVLCLLNLFQPNITFFWHRYIYHVSIICGPTPPAHQISDPIRVRPIHDKPKVIFFKYSINILHEVRFIFRNAKLCERVVCILQNKTLSTGHCKGKLTWTSLDHYQLMNFVADKKKMSRIFDLIRADSTRPEPTRGYLCSGSQRRQNSETCKKEDHKMSS